MSLRGRRFLESYRTFRERNYSDLILGGLLFAFVAILPHITTIYIMGFQPINWLSMSILILVLLWAAASQAWNIISGFTGYFSFGHAAFFGLGAYTTIVLAVEYSLNPWIGFALGTVISGLLGLFIGVFTFRYGVKGHYFALTTLAFSELMRLTFLNVEALGAAGGFFRPFPREYGEDFGITAFQFQGDLGYYYLLLVILIVITSIAWSIKHLSIGLYLRAIRENEQAAKSLGIPTNRLKIFALTVSAGLTAWVGSFYSMYFVSTRPDAVFEVFINVEILLPAVIGGPGTIIGPILGAFFVIPVAEFLRSEFTDINGLHRLIFGIILVLIVLYSPRGIVEWDTRLRKFGRKVLERAGVTERAATDGGEE